MRARPDVAAGARGWTLLEILLVLAIIGVLAAAVVVGIGDAGQRRRVQAEAERLALAIEHARTEAAGRNEVLGMTVSANGYAFKRLGNGGDGWGALTRGALGGWTAEGGVGFEIDVAYGAQGRLQDRGDARRADRRRGGDESEADDADSEEDERAEWPGVAIYPSGEITPLSILVSKEDVPAWVVRSDGIARVRAMSEEEADALGRRPARTMR